MYKEEFKLLYHPNYIDSVEEEKHPKKEVEKEINPCEDVESNYKAEIEKLSEEIYRLNLAISSLEEERRKLIEEKSNLLKKLEDKERLDNFMENILNNMLEMLSKEKENAKNEAINFAINILKRLLLADVLPKEEALVRALSKIFESGIDLKGEINLYLNPTDFQRINPYLEKLKERAEGFFSINPMVREELNEGEFIIETQKLWIERRYEDLLQDIIEDMRDERGLQGLS